MNDMAMETETLNLNFIVSPTMKNILIFPKQLKIKNLLSSKHQQKQKAGHNLLTMVLSYDLF